MFRKLIFSTLFLFLFINISADNIIGRVTFIEGDPLLINSTGQIIHATREMDFSNHIRFRLDPGDKAEIFLPDRAIIRLKDDTEVMLRQVGNEVQVIVEMGYIWFKVIDRTVVRWDNFQISADHALFTTETLVNDMWKVSCMDGAVELSRSSRKELTMASTDRIFVSRKGTVDSVSFSMNSENLKWMDFKEMRRDKQDDNKKTTQLSDSDFILPPGQEEELLVYSAEDKNIRRDKQKIRIDFISPREGEVNIGKSLRVAGRVNTIMVKSVEVYLDDTFLGNIEVNNFMFDNTFNIGKPERAKFLDVVARDVYGNKAVFTIKMVPDTRPPVITIVPPFNVKKTQFFRGFVEDLSVNDVNITINKGNVFEENFTLPVRNGYFEFKMSVDDAQTDAVLVRYGSNHVEIKAVDEFGNTGELKHTFFLNRDLIETYFDK
ncbi:MAG: hypothetical protein ACOCWO_04885 [Candidatus Muiribacteriaceae bacterium]